LPGRNAIDAYLRRYPSLPYVVPLAVFFLFLAIHSYLPFGETIEFPLRAAVLAAVLLVFSRRVIDTHSSRLIESTLLGIAIFLLWIGPDLLFPAYRKHWLFQNALFGRAVTSVPERVLLQPVVLWSRIVRAVVLVPIIEELFFRGWLMRWLIFPRFQDAKLGAYEPRSFWLTALLFASEHGPYWDVGLATGILLNWWIVRTKRLGDCILAHAVANACLCGYVVATHRWGYWL
jgi:CAAX prenyl protease-like protein